MDAPDSPLVLTKLCPPALRPASLPRAHLLQSLEQEQTARLALVCTPPGYGKTTLLATWAQLYASQGNAVAWYSLDAGDNHPLTFAAYLLASLSRATNARRLQELAAAVRSAAELDPARLLPALTNALMELPARTLVVLDDYHLIHAPEVHGLVADLVDHLPEGVRLAMGSRSDPPLHLARLRARGSLVEVRAADLRFSLAETTRFLTDVMRLDLPPDRVAALEERTEGWAAGLQLAALSAAGQPDPGKTLEPVSGYHPYLVDYLLEEVLRRQPAPVQAFLLRTSVLERLQSDLCDALMDRPGASAAILEQLERANVFLSALDARRTWYRYHPLFREFLLGRLHQERPGQAARLHQAAGAWYAGRGALREAAGHIFQVGDWEQAAAYVEQHAFTLLMRSEIALLQEWCAAFPEEVIAAHPSLGVFQCWPWLLRSSIRYRPRIEQRLQQAEQAAQGMVDAEQAQGLALHAATVRAYLVTVPDPKADARAALAAAAARRELEPPGSPGQFPALLQAGYACLALQEARSAAEQLDLAYQAARAGRMYFGMVEASFHRARLATSQGDLEQAERICLERRAEIEELAQSEAQAVPAAVCLDIAQGEAMLEQERLAEAEPLLEGGLERVGWGLNPYYAYAACAALFHLRLAQGRPEDPLAWLDRLEVGWPDVGFCARGLRAMLRLRRQPEDPDAILGGMQWLESFSNVFEQSSARPGMGPFGGAEVIYLASLAWARIQVAVGMPDVVLAYVDRQLPAARHHNLQARVVEISLVEAQAAHALGDDQRAWPAVERALSVGMRLGLTRAFDQGPALNRLLAAAARRGIQRPAIERLLVRQTAAPVPAVPHPVDPLPTWPVIEPPSERELDVLRLLAAGASNQEIASRLVITVGTVKTHINHILGKLNARNRTEAVALARRAGWLDL